MATNSFKIAFSNGVLQYLFVSGPGVRVPAKIASFLPVLGQKSTEGKGRREEQNSPTTSTLRVEIKIRSSYFCTLSFFTILFSI